MKKIVIILFFFFPMAAHSQSSDLVQGVINILINEAMRAEKRSPSVNRGPAQEGGLKNTDCTVSKSQTKELQAALKKIGFYTGAIDGLYGRGTKNAASRYQESKGLQQTGCLTSPEVAMLQSEEITSKEKVPISTSKSIATPKKKSFECRAVDGWGIEKSWFARDLAECNYMISEYNRCLQMQSMSAGLTRCSIQYGTW